MYVFLRKPIELIFVGKKKFANKRETIAYKRETFVI